MKNKLYIFFVNQMNKYRNPNSTIVGTDGLMYNQATKIFKKIDYPHYGIFSNDNTYPATFNPYINKPPTLKVQQEIVRPPPTNQHITKPYCEPPVCLTDSRAYIHHATAKPAPLLPPYLNKPEDLGRIQGLCDKRMKEYVIYGPTQTIVQKNIQY